MLAESQQFTDALGHRLEQGFRQFADRIAIECDEETLTYRDLDQRVERLALYLAQAGVMPGDCVPLLIHRSTALVVAELALLRIGAVYAPIDLASPPDRQRMMLERLAAMVYIVDGSSDLALPAEARCIDVNDPAIDAVRGVQPWLPPPACDVAYIMFTSGSTGGPKGARVPRSGILRLVVDTDYAEFRSDARWGFVSSPAFDLSTLEVFAPLLHGACCVIQARPLPSIDEIADFLLSRHISDTWLTAALFNTCVDLRPDAFGRLRQLLVGGERVSPLHARRLLEAWPAVRLINGYGPTENTTFSLCHTITLADTELPEGIPIGRAINGTVLRIDGGGESGELLTGGPGVAFGYLGDPDLSARKYFEEDGVRWYRTGDLVRRRADGVYEFHGRVDRQVKIQGHRIELDEVENALLACPGVGDGAVLVVGDEAQDRHLVAFYSGRGGEPPAPAAIRQRLKAEMPPNAVPRVLKPLIQLPLNINGKLDRKALQALCVAEAAAQTGPQREAFASETEWRLAELWWACLPGKTPLRPESDFWEMGGSSLIALTLSTLVSQRLGLPFAPIEVLRHPVLADQARRLEAAGAPAEKAAPAPDSFALSSAQRLHVTRGAGFWRVRLQLAAGVDADALKAAFEQLRARHLSLRMRLLRTAEGAWRAGVVDAAAQGWWHEGAHLPASSLPDVLTDGVMRVALAAPMAALRHVDWHVHALALDEHGLAQCLRELDLLLRGESLPPGPPGTLVGFAAFEASLRAPGAASQQADALRQSLHGIELPALLRGAGALRTEPFDCSDQLSLDFSRVCRTLQANPAVLVLTAWSQALQALLGAPAWVSVRHSRRLTPELVAQAGCLSEEVLYAPAVAGDGSLAAAFERVQAAYAQGASGSAAGLGELLQALADAPLLCEQAQAFAFCWGRSAVGAGAPAALAGVECVQAPQPGARVALRAWLLEGRLHCELSAPDKAFAEGWCARLEQALRAQLATLLTHLSARSRAVADVDAGAVDARLGEVWLRHRGRSGQPALAGANFLLDGGSEDEALAMLAELQRHHGLVVEAGQFLPRPGFRTLQTALPAAHEAPNLFECIGRSDAAGLIVLLPGLHGDILSMFRLGQEIRRLHGDDLAVVLPDLDRLLEALPSGADPVDYLEARCVAWLSAFGAQRVVGIAGFSISGLLALRLARALAPAAPPPVWMLDTCTPAAYSQNWQRDLAWAGSNLLFGSVGHIGWRLSRKLNHVLARAGFSARLRTPPRASWEENANPHTLAAWGALRRALSRMRLDPAGVRAHLLVAERSRADFGLLRRRSTNGFTRRDFGELRTTTLDVRHEEMTRTEASLTASVLSRELRGVALTQAL